MTAVKTLTMENKMKTLLFIFAFSCTSSESQKTDTDAEQTQAPCELFAPTGTYEMTYQTVDSNCGGMGVTQTEVSHGIVQPDSSAACRLVQVDWDEGPCITHSVFDCDDGLWDMLLDWRVIPNSSDSFSGTLDATMLRFTGWDCAGRYDFEAFRLEE